MISNASRDRNIRLRAGYGIVLRERRAAHERACVDHDELIEHELDVRTLLRINEALDPASTNAAECRCASR
jgi:hypothetical protein